VIDLHMHTTASDGRLSPRALVAAAAAAGIQTIAVTDHDTTAGVAEATAAGRDAGLTVVPGIEITAVHEQRDVHVLGYYLDGSHPDLAAFLVRQRADRRRRIVELVERLGALGAPIELPADLMTRESIGRPVVAAALVAAGHVSTMQEAFDRYLAEGRPAFVPRTGGAPAEVVALIAEAGGCAALAHSGKLKVADLDAFVASLAEAGMPAIEVHHPDHDEADRTRLLGLAARHGLLVTGGSDYHGPDDGRADAFGRIGLPPDDYERLVARFGPSAA
jgi:predicted metal-dependent phosphoesterase TrpH